MGPLFCCIVNSGKINKPFFASWEKPLFARREKAFFASGEMKHIEPGEMKHIEPVETICPMYLLLPMATPAPKGPLLGQHALFVFTLGNSGYMGQIVSTVPFGPNLTVYDQCKYE